MKWVKRILLGLLTVIVVAVGTLYAWSAVIIGKSYTAQTRSVETSTDPQVLARGEHLAQVYGCFNACHGEDMRGDVMIDNWLVATFVAPNITNIRQRYSMEEIEALIRQGIRPDGTSVLAMPSASLSVMTDEDLAALISFVTAEPQADKVEKKNLVGPLGRLGLIMRKYEPSAVNATREPWQEGFRENPMKLGEYIAIMACTECHGQELEGSDGFSPPLVIAKSYSLEDFSEFMSTGVALGGRDVGLMGTVAERRFTHFTEDEIEALHTYLNSL